MRRRQLPGEPPPPTKGELKRQARDTQDLADRLIAAPAALVAGLRLPEKLADAIALARRITSHGALSRQRLFVARLLRGIDPAPIRQALEAQREASRQAAARFRRAERWRGRLVTEREPAIAEFFAEFPQADRQELSRLVESAAAECRAGKSTSAGRELFRWVQARLTEPAR